MKDLRQIIQEAIKKQNLKEHKSCSCGCNSCGDLLKENEEQSDDLEKELSLALLNGLNDLKKNSDEINDEIEDANVPLNEAITSLLISLILSAPKLMEILGGMVNRMGNSFREESTTNKFGDKFIHAGHSLEKKYLTVIKSILKLTGVTKEAHIKSKHDYDVAARVVLYTVLGAAAVTAGFATSEAIASFIAGKGISTAVYGATKGGLATLKTQEIIKGIKGLVK